MPGVNFILGYDTYARLFNPQFYTSDQQIKETASIFTQLGTKFIVFGRKDPKTGRFLTMKDKF